MIRELVLRSGSSNFDRQLRVCVIFRAVVGHYVVHTADFIRCLADQSLGDQNAQTY